MELAQNRAQEELAAPGNAVQTGPATYYTCVHVRPQRRPGRGISNRIQREAGSSLTGLSR